MKRPVRESLNALLILLGILSASMGIHGFLLSSHFIDGGVTVYKGRGGLSFEDQEILYCVVTRLEIGKVKTIVRALDPGAFVTSHPLADVQGGMVKHPALH